jgi:protein-S-isoprenylcysteine O-methyltransferase Ste14
MLTSLLALAVGAYASHIWGAMFFFVAGDREGRAGRLSISVLGGSSMVAALYALATSKPGGLQLSVAGLLLAGSFLLFWWARWRSPSRLAFAFSSASPHTVNDRGPYRWVRHPFYAAYILGWLAPAVAAPGALTTTILVVMTTIYWLAARREEQQFEQSALAERYRAYRSRTGMLVPKL